MLILRAILIALLFFPAEQILASEPGCLSNEPITIVIRNDDINVVSNPQWEQKLLDLFIARQIPQSVGFIPQISSHMQFHAGAERHDIDELPEIVALYAPLIETGIIDPALHGQTHQNNYLHAGDQLTPSQSSEFSGLPMEVQKKMLQTGKEVLENTLQHPISVFIPPWNNLDDNTVLALEQLGFVGISEHSLYRTDKLKTRVPFAQRMKPLDKLPGLLQDWQQEGKCQGKLNPGIYVFLYHSWTQYSDEGLQHMSNLLDQVQESGVKVSTLSKVFLTVK